MLTVKYLNPKIKKTPVKTDRELLDEQALLWMAKQEMKFREKLLKQAK